MKIADITGAWKVNITATGGTQVPLGSEWTAVIRAKQNDSIVSGAFVTEHGLTGKITGHVIGDMVSMTIDQGPIRPGTFQGVSQVNDTNNKMIGTYSGNDGGGSLETSTIAHKMKYYEYILYKIRVKLCSTSSEEEKGIPLWIMVLFWVGIALFVAIIFLAHHFVIPLIEKAIPDFKGYLLLGVILIFGFYGLYRYIKDK